MCTLHANSAREAVVKMRILPLLAGENIGTAFVVPTVASSVDLVVHVGTEVPGHHRVREIVAVSPTFQVAAAQRRRAALLAAVARMGLMSDGPRSLPALTSRLLSPQMVRKTFESRQLEPILTNGKGAAQGRNVGHRRRSQGVEIRTFNPRVVGSIPTGPTVLMCCFG
jgi:hypothetical protein